MTTTPEENAMLRRVAEAARDIVASRGVALPLAITVLADTLRALDAYQPPVEPAWQRCGSCGQSLPPLSLALAAREARKPRPPGELVEAVMERVLHKDVTEVCPQCEGRPHFVPCAMCRGTGRVPKSRPARSTKVTP